MPKSKRRPYTAEEKAARKLRAREYRKTVGYTTLTRVRLAARKIALRDVLSRLKDQACLDCAGRFPVECMDFDHRPGTVKVENVGRLLGQASTLTKLLAEIAKCDLVCANCHRVRTMSRRRP